MNGAIWLKDHIVNGHILINEENGTIDKISTMKILKHNQKQPRINLKGKLILPSFIDIHAHLRDFEESNKETYEIAAHAAAVGGFTTVFDMPNKNPPINSSKRLKAVLEKAKKIEKVDIIPYILLSEKTEPELLIKYPYVKAYLSSTTGGYITDIRDIKEYLMKNLGHILSVHCEDLKKIQQNAQKFPNTLENHSKIRNAQVEISAINELLKVRKRINTNTRVHIAHVSLSVSIGLIKSNKLSFEVTPHHLTLNNKDFLQLGVKGKMNPPLRQKKEQEKLWNSFLQGNIPIVSTDHAPHTLEEKVEAELSGVPGLETCLPVLLDKLQPMTQQKLSLIVDTLAVNPRRLMNLPEKGIISEKEPANLTIVDLSMKKRIKRENLKTKCKWSPWEGIELQGWPVLTIKEGKITFNGLL
ncbi:MAG: dihydroorotase family protein [Candidatus Hodarchaeota archaeon]